MKTIAIKEINGVLERIGALNPAYRYMRDGDGDGVVCE